MLVSALGALLVTLVVTVGTYLASRQFLIAQRERTAVLQAYADAAYVSEGLRSRGSDLRDLLATTGSSPGGDVIVNSEGRWYSTNLTSGVPALPAGVTQGVREGHVTYEWSTSAGEPVLVVGVPLVASGAELYEVVRAPTLETTLATLRGVLVTAGIVGILLAALVGRSVAGRVLRPLAQIGEVAGRVGAGDLRTRLPETDDPDLREIVESFNVMVANLDARIQRDSRFASDVAHELRSPLMTLTTSVRVLQNRRDELSERTRTALDLINAEVERLEHTLEDLLQLGRIDAGRLAGQAEPVDATELARQTLLTTGRGEVPIEAAGVAPVLVDKQHLARALVNLLDNADRHGGGAARVLVDAETEQVRISVHDNGSGVPAAERERIFERFVRGASARATSVGSGLGLPIVAELAAAYGGSVTVDDAPGGGAAFTLVFPRAGS